MEARFSWLRPAFRRVYFGKDLDDSLLVGVSITVGNLAGPPTRAARPLRTLACERLLSGCPRPVHGLRRMRIRFAELCRTIREEARRTPRPRRISRRSKGPLGKRRAGIALW